jgi:alkylated DNA repair dioxygenase AlkB
MFYCREEEKAVRKQEEQIQLQVLPPYRNKLAVEQTHFLFVMAKANLACFYNPGLKARVIYIKSKGL